MSARLAVFDRARFRLVLGVVVLHAACGYSRLVPWWPVQGPPSVLADLLVAVLDVFLMPFLFFIAGFFAPASAATIPAGAFLAKKARRLLAPYLPLLLFYLPAMTYCGYRQRTAEPEGFFAYWQSALAGLADFRPRLLTTVDQGLAGRDALSPHLLWFVSLLFVFFLLYRLTPGLRVLLARPARSQAAVWALASAAMIAAMTGLNLAMPAESWWRWNVVLLAQPVRLPLYLGLFLLGAAAGASSGRGVPAVLTGRAWPLLAGGAVALAAAVALGGVVHAAGPVPVAAMVLHAVARVAANALLILGCLRLGQNRPRPLSGGEAALAAGSYDVYLLHEPLVVFLGYAAVQAALPAVAALPLVVATAVGACLLVSAKLVRPRPGLALVGLGLFFAALCLLFP